jgi:hypothetical protein
MGTLYSRGGIFLLRGQGDAKLRISKDIPVSPTDRTLLARPSRPALALLLRTGCTDPYYLAALAWKAGLFGCAVQLLRR